MRRHIGVVSGTAVALAGVALAVAAFSGFDLLLPAVRIDGPSGISWLLIAWVLVLAGFAIAVVASGIQAAREDATASLAAVRTLVRREQRLAPVIPIRPETLAS